MTHPSPETAIRDAIRHWSDISQLAEFALRQHGYSDTNGGFGVTHPGDLEYDRAIDGVRIPAGFILVYGFGGPSDGYELLVRESDYRTPSRRNSGGEWLPDRS
jgi:hypothetical protein